MSTQATDGNSENKAGATSTATQQGAPPTDATKEPNTEQSAFSKDTGSSNSSKSADRDTRPTESESSADSKGTVTRPKTSEASTSAAVLSGTGKAERSHTETHEEMLARCEENLLRHINGMHDSIEEQLDMIETQVAGKKMNDQFTHTQQ